MGKINRMSLEVHLDGRDQPILVEVDQRDYAAWEAHPLADLAPPVTKIRYLAFSAGRRSGAIGKGVSWDEFNTMMCVQALVPDSDLPDEDADGGAEDEEGEQGLNPGR